MRGIAWVLLLAVTFPVPAPAGTGVEPGARVRVRVDGHSTIGMLDRIESGRLHLQGDERSWDLTRVERFEVSTGRSGNAPLGAFVGVIAGFALGFVAANAVNDSPASFAPTNDEIQKKALALFGVWGGSVVTGALIGHVVKTDEWELRSVPSAGGASGSSSAVGAGLRFRF